MYDPDEVIRKGGVFLTDYPEELRKAIEVKLHVATVKGEQYLHHLTALADGFDALLVEFEGTLTEVAG